MLFSSLRLTTVTIGIHELFRATLNSALQSVSMVIGLRAESIPRAERSPDRLVRAA